MTVGAEEDGAKVVPVGAEVAGAEVAGAEVAGAGTVTVGNWLAAGAKDSAASACSAAFGFTGSGADFACIIMANVCVCDCVCMRACVCV